MQDEERIVRTRDLSDKESIRHVAANLDRALMNIWHPIVPYCCVVGAVETEAVPVKTETVRVARIIDRKIVVKRHLRSQTKYDC